MREALHKAITWTPGSGCALVTGVAALGGETVRVKIWDVIVSALHDPTSIAVIFAVIVMWCVLWCATRPSKQDKGGDSYSQNHSGAGDNNMDFRG